MSQSYRSFFGFAREPFSSELKVQEILKTEAVLAVADRVDYAIRLGSMILITGEVGSGKSTALRFAMSRLHPSEYRLLWVNGHGRLDPGALSPDRLGDGGGDRQFQSSRFDADHP